MIKDGEIIPKEQTIEPIKMKEDYYSCICPRCHGNLSEIYTLWIQGCLDYSVNEVHYCVYCGQRLKFGEEFEKR